MNYMYLDWTTLRIWYRRPTPLDQDERYQHCLFSDWEILGKRRGIQ